MNDTPPMDPKAIYAGTLQLKQLAERRLVVCQHDNQPEKAADWRAAVAYFERQLQVLPSQLQNIESVAVETVHVAQAKTR